VVFHIPSVHTLLTAHSVCRRVHRHANLHWLLRTAGTCLTVSHNRDFLNSVCTDIIHFYDKDLHFYAGYGLSFLPPPTLSPPSITIPFHIKYSVFRNCLIVCTNLGAVVVGVNFISAHAVQTVTPQPLSPPRTSPLSTGLVCFHTYLGYQTGHICPSDLGSSDLVSVWGPGVQGIPHLRHSCAIKS
jgi:hypothetical protein